jgi:Tfp pilus assembly protein PilX
MYIGHVPAIVKILLVVVAIVALRELRCRDDRDRRSGDAEALALISEVKATLARLEERITNLETLLPGTADPGDRKQFRPGSPGKRGGR